LEVSEYGYGTKTSQGTESRVNHSSVRTVKANMMFPSVSVIVRMYNPNEWALDAINSIIKQTYEGKIEIVICYDKASRTNNILDKLKQLASQISERRVVRLIEHDPMGPAQAFFECGLSLSTGDYIMFLDYDNVMPENYIDEVIKIIKQNENFDCLCTNPMLMSECGEILGQRLMKVPSKINVFSLARGNFCDTNGLVLSRKAVNIILELYNKYLKRLRLLTYLLVDDYLTALVCVKMFGVKYIDSAYVYYRIHQDQLVYSSNRDIGKINQIRIRNLATLYMALTMLNDHLSLFEKLYIGIIMMGLVTKLFFSNLL